MWWPKLEDEVAGGLEIEPEAAGEARRSERDILEEVLALTRRYVSDKERRMELDHPAWDDLFTGLLELARVTRNKLPDAEAVNALKHLRRPLEYLAHREMRGRPRSARRVLVELQDILSAGEEIPVAATNDVAS